PSQASAQSASPTNAATAPLRLARLAVVIAKSISASAKPREPRSPPMRRGAGMNPAATISILSARPVVRRCVGEGEGVAVRAVVDGTGVVVVVGVPVVVDEIGRA